MDLSAGLNPNTNKEMHLSMKFKQSIFLELRNNKNFNGCHKQSPYIVICANEQKE
jgi:hypothetical protein